MPRLYKLIRCIRLKKVFLDKEKKTHWIEIRDRVFIERFRRIVENVPVSKHYAGNPKTPRYFVEIVGRGSCLAKGEVQPLYAFFNHKRLLIQDRALWNLIEGFAVPMED